MGIYFGNFTGIDPPGRVPKIYTEDELRDLKIFFYQYICTCGVFSLGFYEKCLSRVFSKKMGIHTERGKINCHVFPETSFYSPLMPTPNATDGNLETRYFVFRDFPASY